MVINNNSLSICVFISVFHICFQICFHICVSSLSWIREEVLYSGLYKHSKFVKATNGLEQSRPFKFSVEFFFLITAFKM